MLSLLLELEDSFLDTKLFFGNSLSVPQIERPGFDIANLRGHAPPPTQTPRKLKFLKWPSSGTAQ